MQNKRELFDGFKIYKRSIVNFTANWEFSLFFSVSSRHPQTSSTINDNSPLTSSYPQVVEYSNDCKDSPPCIPSSYCNLPSIKQTFFVAQNTVPKYLRCVDCTCTCTCICYFTCISTCTFTCTSTCIVLVLLILLLPSFVLVFVRRTCTFG